MKAVRESSFICSGTDTPEYKLIQQLTPELRTAIQDDLLGISDHLPSCGMITQENHEDFTNWARPIHTLERQGCYEQSRTGLNQTLVVILTLLKC